MIARIALALVLSVGQVFAATRAVEFVWKPDRDVKAVAVAGSFNGWSRTAAPLVRSGAGWTGALTLPEGRHTYKFVLDGTVFLPDPRAAERVPDGFGGYNSVVRVGTVFARPARRGDGKISAEGVCHAQTPRFVAALPDGRVALRLIVRAGDVEAVKLSVPGDLVGCERVATDGDEELYEAVLDRMPAKYVFDLRDGGKQQYFGPRGLTPASGREGVFERVTPTPWGSPSWLTDAVFYQIFPERFANGDRRNDPPRTDPWGAPPKNDSWSGGDLDGVRQHLGHLTALGVNALYFNPIFEAESNHGYNTADYDHVAVRFGGDRAFERLLAALKSRGMRVVLDGVFNHTGTAFFAFRDLVARGAQSAHAAWYDVRAWPVDPKAAKPTYDCWWGYGSLPRLMVDRNADVRKYLLDAVRRWTRAGIDGWRLDVPNEVDHPFWKQFRRAVRFANPDAYIVGEIWEDGTPWLQGDEFDGVMNYRFRRALVEWLAKGTIDAPAAARQLDRIRMDYPPGRTLALYNLLSSHDTERFRTLAGGLAWKQELATAAMLTAPGVPSIYYGDELGMEGGKDPDNRRTFPWKGPRDERMLATHRELIALRRTHGLGRFGEASHHAWGPDVLAFTRRDAAGRLLVVALNRGAANALLPDELRRRRYHVLRGLPDVLAARTATVLLSEERER